VSPSDEQLTDLRQEMVRRRDGRCVQVDADGCRCLRRPDKHKGACDFSYTPWCNLDRPHPDTLVLG
jgi:hypothetical protein